MTHCPLMSSNELTVPPSSQNDYKRPPSPKPGPRSGRLAYKRGQMHNISDVLKDFSRVTSAHGIPQVGYSRNNKEKILWLIIFIICISILMFQAYKIASKFFRYEKSTQIELKFEAAPFPAVTVCNLNPYKNSMVQLIPGMRESLSAFQHIKENGASANRGKRASNTEPRNYQPVQAFCSCPNLNRECSPIERPIVPMDTKCYCYRDNEFDSIWPCFHQKTWTKLTCKSCSTSGRCLYPRGITVGEPCMCHHQTKRCIWLPTHVETIGDAHLFTTVPSTTSTTTVPSTTTETTSTSTSTSSTSTSTTSTSTSTTTSTTRSTTSTAWDGAPTAPSIEQLQDLGIENVTDEILMVSKIKESMIFTMAEEPEEVRIRSSHSKSELISKCSFNMEECSESRFKLHLDAVYGNCYTFNWDQTKVTKSTRAGPAYGLRILVYVDISEYMRTTEAAGIRFATHQTTDYPFPDTFGYSAPVGLVSSFGIKMKSLTRLPKPYGDCKDFQGQQKRQDYVYPGSYSTEGCFRSCFQQLLVDRCGCGDPRFPVPDNATHCSMKDRASRDCINDVVKSVGDYQKVKGCDHCQQPCRQMMYSMSYSAATWPASSYRMGDCLDDDYSCNENYSKNAVLLEIYFEQLNFETVEEFAAYPVESLLADLGGQLGLWVGFSVMTLIELMVLFLQLGSFPCWRVTTSSQEGPEIPKILMTESVETFVNAVDYSADSLQGDLDCEKCSPLIRKNGQDFSAISRALE